jgi:hypothetical protein
LRGSHSQFGDRAELKVADFGLAPPADNRYGSISSGTRESGDPMLLRVRQSPSYRWRLFPLCGVLIAGARPAAIGASPAGSQREITAIKAVLSQFIQYSQQGALESPAARKLLTGEAAQRWHTATFGVVAAAPDAVALLGPNQGVARLQWFGANGQVTDCYFYLKRVGAWKLSATRSLSLTGIIEQAVLELRAKANRTPAEQAQLDNMELTLACDKVLRRHFQSHRAEFEQLRRLAHPAGHPSPTASIRQKLVGKLHLDRVDVRGNGDIDFLIGGVSDNSVGYLYCPSDRPPAISPSEYIWVEKLAPKWYLYRTT